MSIELKIKSKHLGEEARIIRFEELKLRKQVRWIRLKHKATGANEPLNVSSALAETQRERLRKHRVQDVRRENRATFLARAYIARCSYKSVEKKRKPEREFEFQIFVLPRVVNMVAKYNLGIPLKVWNREKGGYVDNPELLEVRKTIESWIETEA
jgi:hypothetical protein